VDPWSCRGSQVIPVGRACKLILFNSPQLDLFLRAKNNVLVTGGEDSKINIWASSPLDSETSSSIVVEQEDEPMDVDIDDPAPSRKRGWESGKAKNDWDDQSGKRVRRC
jgi:hypothetical protein